MTTPSIREKFEKLFEKEYGKEPASEYTPSGECEDRWHWAYKHISAKWAFLEGMRVASEIARENEDYDMSIERNINKAIKEFTDEHPK